MVRNFILALTLALMSLSSGTDAFAARTSNVPGNTVASASSGQSIIDRTVSLISQGKFEQAEDILKQNSSGDNSPSGNGVKQLQQIVDQYKEINQRSKQAKDNVYSEKLAALDKLKAQADANGYGDFNDVNDITNALAAIVNVSELADNSQRQKLLSDTFVKKLLQISIDKAADYEVQGKWLEAYTSCYAWLTLIDPNNKAYSNYSQQLYDKAVIEASLEDSPCETRKERYEGVDKVLFARAITHLDLYFVDPIDYNDVANKALKRCKLLTETLKFKSANLLSLTSDVNAKAAPVIDEKAMAAWTTGLNILVDDVKKSSVPMKASNFLVLFDKVLKLNTATISIPEVVLVDHFSEAALAAYDPYTVLVWPKEVDSFQEKMTNEFRGIGVEISKPKGMLTIGSLLLDTPAYKAGLDAGDIIEAVDGIPTIDMPLNCAVRKIKGPEGSKVKLTIKRVGEDKPRDFIVTREKIVVPTVRGWQRTDSGKWRYMIDDQNEIGYVRLTSFSEESAIDMNTVLTDLEKKGMKGLIIDLRYNSGGYLNVAVDIADLFIEEGLIVRTQPGYGKLPVLELAKKKGTHPNYPLVILTNSSSASASEIVAGALADKKYNRAVLVGERTHGKGKVQGITSAIGNGAELKYTIAYYHLPSGQRVESRDAMEKLGRDDWGVAPNIKVEMNGQETTKMLDVQRDNDVLVQVNHENGGKEVQKHTKEETLASDKQLAVAVLAVKSKLIQLQQKSGDTTTAKK
jgi:carboxyl-terminal processing protease